MGNLSVEESIAFIRQHCRELKPKVVVRCITFNHGLYIREALESLVMQQTDFPYVVIVHDDVSCDSTQDIIKEYAQKYPDIILPIFETENQYSKRDGSFYKIITEATEATGADYVALCEGDDFWTDNLKLQKEADFLDQNPEFGLCCTDCLQLENSETKPFILTTQSIISFKSLLQKNQVATLTVMYRRKFIQPYSALQISKYKFPLGDYPLWLFIASQSKLRHFDFSTACYRVLPESASHTSDLKKRLLFLLGYFEIQILFSKGYPWLRFKAKINRIKTILKYSLKKRSLGFLKYIFHYQYLRNANF